MKNKIVISAVNFVTGGQLSVLRSVYQFAVRHLISDYEVIFVLRAKEMIENPHPAIQIIEIPSGKKSFVHKLYFEYWYFYFLSKRIRPYLWFSLNDCSPTVASTMQAVYFHNASILYKPNLLDLRFPSRIFFQKAYYYFFFRINIHRNSVIIVQQEQFKNYISRRFSVPLEKLLVIRPDFNAFNAAPAITEDAALSQTYTFFYPTKPDPYKNTHIIIKAVELMKSRHPELRFQVLLTLSGDENRYSRYLAKMARMHSEIVFTGFLNPAELSTKYQNSHCLLFPSRIESWGLPLSEAASLNMRIVAADLAYAHETLESYGNAEFFDPENANALADIMVRCIRERPSGSAPTTRRTNRDSWSLLFSKLKM